MYLVSEINLSQFEYITKERLKNERGWTPKLMKEFLEGIEYKEKTNPRYKKASPMKLYKIEDIEKIERTEEFKKLKKEADKRKEISKKGVETKTQKTLNLSDNFSVAVKRIPLKELRKRSIESKQRYYDAIGEYYFIEPNEETIERWQVNYIRHELTDYDRERFDLDGKVGKIEGYINYRERLKDEMKKTYPELAESIDKYMPKYIITAV